jgi:WD40 repeat protein
MTVFADALERTDPADRAAYLDRACEGNAPLRRRVEALLAAHNGAGQFLEPGAAGMVEPASAETLGGTGALAPGTPPGTELLTGEPRPDGNAPTIAGTPPADHPGGFVPGQIIAGRYTLREVLGEGGMGAVYRAEQSQPVKRQVALKLIKTGMDSRAVLARFDSERQALALMDHPNIARVYDGGATEANQPFFVMELVNGIAITKYCDLHRLPVRARLELFVAVCQAVQHAHQKGIIHRDLSPGNVLVTEVDGRPTPKIIDFGVAKATEFNLTDLSLADTGAIVGTPMYMSPEQADPSAMDIDTRTDIYALGVILYELLAGSPPLDPSQFKRGAFLEMLRMVREVDPPRPSTKVSTSDALPNIAASRNIDPAHLKRELQGDLDWIVMKALEKDRSRRYATANGFATDVVRHLAHEPVLAAPPSRAYRMGKFVRKHRGGVIAASLVLLALLAGVAGTTWGLIEATRQERMAREQAAQKERARLEALAAADAGKKAKERAEAAEQTAKASETVAMQEKETARKALARVRLDLAEKEFERGKFVESQKILEETPETYRDGNWHFLQANSRDFTTQLSLPGKGTANRLQFLPQGDRFVATFHGNAIGIFTLAGRQVGDWIPAEGKDRFATSSSDRAGARLAFAASSNEVAIHEVATGKLLRRWTSEVGEIHHVLLSPDGEMALAIGREQVSAYATQTGAPLWKQPFKSVVPAFSPDGRTLAMVVARSGASLRIQLSDPRTGTARNTLEATADNPTKTSLQFTRAGDRLACLGGDEVILWDAKSGEKERALHFPGETVMLLSPRGDAVATISGSRVRLWDTATGRLLRSLSGARADARALAFSPDGKTLLSSQASSSDGIVSFWPIHLGEEITAVRLGLGGRRVLFDRDGAKFYACAATGAGAWENRTGVQRLSLSWSGTGIRHLAIHPTDESIVVSECRKPTLTHLTAAGEALPAFGTNADSSLEFNRSGRLLLTVDYAFDQSDPGSAFCVMEYATGKVLRRIPLTKPHQPFAGFCLGDAAVATAASGGGITVWDLEAGKPLWQIDAAQTGSIACLTVSPDGRRLATGGPDRWIRTWEAATGRLESAFRAHWESVRCLKFSPDGGEVLSGGEDGTVRIHDALTGACALVLYGNTTPVAGVDFSPEGTLIAAITTDGFAKVWDRKTSSQAALLPRRPSAKTTVAAKDADRSKDLLEPRGGLAPLTDADIKRIAALPAAEQVEEVRKELMRRNPGFDCEVGHKIEGGVVTEFRIVTDHVTDISPIRVWNALRVLDCRGPQAGHDPKGILADLTPLQGMNLTRLISLDLSSMPVRDAGLVYFKPCKDLNYLGLDSTRVGDAGLANFKDCKKLVWATLARTKASDAGLADFKDCEELTKLDLDGTQVTDAGLAHFKGHKNLSWLRLSATQVSDAGLAHLKDIPLAQLMIYNTQITDLTPLQGMPLEEIRLTPRNITRGVEILREMKSLKTIGIDWIRSWPAAEFWDRYDKGEFK